MVHDVIPVVESPSVESRADTIIRVAVAGVRIGRIDKDVLAPVAKHQPHRCDDERDNQDPEGRQGQERAQGKDGGEERELTDETLNCNRPSAPEESVDGELDPGADREPDPVPVRCSSRTQGVIGGGASTSITIMIIHFSFFRSNERQSGNHWQDHVQQKVERVVALIRLGGRDVVRADVVFLSLGVSIQKRNQEEESAQR